MHICIHTRNNFKICFPTWQCLMWIALLRGSIPLEHRNQKHGRRSIYIYACGAYPRSIGTLPRLPYVTRHLAWCHVTISESGDSWHIYSAMGTCCSRRNRFGFVQKKKCKLSGPMNGRTNLWPLMTSRTAAILNGHGAGNATELWRRPLHFAIAQLVYMAPWSLPRLIADEISLQSKRICVQQLFMHLYDLHTCDCQDFSFVFVLQQLSMHLISAQHLTHTNLHTCDCPGYAFVLVLNFDMLLTEQLACNNHMFHLRCALLNCKLKHLLQANECKYVCF